MSQFLTKVSGKTKLKTITASDVGLGNVTNTAQVPLSTVTTKGDFILGTANATVARQGVSGVNGKCMVEDSTKTNGVTWSDPVIPSTRITAIFGENPNPLIPFILGWQDTFLFKTISDIEYWDGGAWTAWVTTGINELLDGNLSTGLVVDTTHGNFRFTVDVVNTYIDGLIYITSDYTYASPREFDLTVEYSTDKVSWSSLLTDTCPENTYHYLRYVVAALLGRYIRVSINLKSISTSCLLRNVKFLTMRPGYGNWHNLPYTTAYDKTITTLGAFKITTIAALGTVATTFLTHSSGTVQSRTVAQVLSDIGAVGNSVYTTKGDMLIATGASTPVRFPVGAVDNYALLVDSTQTTGVKWGQLLASLIIPDTTNFNNNLSSADNTLQKALDTLDNLTITNTDDTYFINRVLGRDTLIP